MRYLLPAHFDPWMEQEAGGGFGALGLGDFWDFRWEMFAVFGPNTDRKKGVSIKRFVCCACFPTKNTSFLFVFFFCATLI